MEELDDLNQSFDQAQDGCDEQHPLHDPLRLRTLPFSAMLSLAHESTTFPALTVASSEGLSSVRGVASRSPLVMQPALRQGESNSLVTLPVKPGAERVRSLPFEGGLGPSVYLAVASRKVATQARGAFQLMATSLREAMRLSSR